MTLYATEAQRFGLCLEASRGTAETTPTKWYPSRGPIDLNYVRNHLQDTGLRGIAAKFTPVAGIKMGDGKIPLFFDAQNLGEFTYSLLGGKSSTEDATITISVSNNKLDFNIGGGELTATIPSATYLIGTSQAIASSLCKAIYDAIVAAEATGTYTVTYSRSTKLFTIARSAGTFQMKFLTGTNNLVSIDTTLGYTHTDKTGAITYTGANTIEYAFTHTFTQSGILPPAYTFFLDRSLNVLKYNRGCIKALNFKGGVDNLVEVDAEILFETEASGSIGSPSFPTQRYMSFQTVAFKIAGATDTNVKEWELKIDNSARAHRTLAGTADLTDIIAPEPISIEGGFTIYFANTTERDKFIANTSVALRVLAQGDTIVGSSKWACDINIYAAKYKAFPYGEDQGLLAAKVSFEGFYSTSDSKAIQIAITNQDVSY